jgi:hypothetical protein
MDVDEIKWEGVDWIDMAPDKNKSQALVNAVMNSEFT